MLYMSSRLSKIRSLHTLRTLCPGRFILVESVYIFSHRKNVFSKDRIFNGVPRNKLSLRKRSCQHACLHIPIKRSWKTACQNICNAEIFRNRSVRQRFDMLILLWAHKFLISEQLSLPLLTLDNWQYFLKRIIDLKARMTLRTTALILIFFVINTLN